MSAPPAVLAAAFLFNLGQGVLRPSLPLYLQQSFSANYRMVNLIPVAFGVGKWAASLPTGFLLHRLGRRLMIWGLVLLALVDVGSVMTGAYPVFLGLRGLGGVGWAMFATVATASVVSGAGGRGRTVSLLLVSETSGLLVGSAAGGWLYQSAGLASPFVFEAACMLVAALAVGRWTGRGVDQPRTAATWRPSQALVQVLRLPGVLPATAANAALTAVQTGIVVFLVPLHLVNRTGVTPAVVGLLVSLTIGGRLTALLLGGGLSDRWGRIRVLVPGLLAHAGLLIALPALNDPVLLGLWSVALGAVTGIAAPIPTALVGDAVPAALHGVAIGWLRTMTDAGHILGPLVMGAVADAGDPSTPLLVGAALLVLAAWPFARAAHPAR